MASAAAQGRLRQQQVLAGLTAARSPHGAADPRRAVRSLLRRLGQLRFAAQASLDPVLAQRADAPTALRAWQQRLRRALDAAPASQLEHLEQGLYLLLPPRQWPLLVEARRWSEAALRAGLPLPAPRLQALPLRLLLQRCGSKTSPSTSAPAPSSPVAPSTRLDEQAWRAVAPELPPAQRPAWRDALLGALAGARPDALVAPERLLASELLMVGNAGLVLTGPFLPRLWRRLGLLDAEGQAFAAPAAARRAALLLQLLASGADGDCPEHLLPLCKLLCGLPLAEPLPRRLDADSQEREAIEGLLQALIRHWAALGRTSVPGFRSSFLMRQGALRQRDEDWQLQVQSRSYDLLLDRLPWAYKTLKLPWMGEVLHVEWR